MAKYYPQVIGETNKAPRYKIICLITAEPTLEPGSDSKAQLLNTVKHKVHVIAHRLSIGHGNTGICGKLEQCPLKQSLGKRLLIPETSFVQSLARSAPLVKVGAPPSFSANPNTEVTLPNPTLAGDWASQKVCPLEESWLIGNHRLFSSASKLGFRGSGSWEMDPQEFWLAHQATRSCDG